ncbi:MAG: 50S ribosomal protein L25 [candidate division WOR-3 bacterium]
MELSVKLREKLGKENAKKLRKSGLIPAVIYGHGEENLHVAVDEKELHEVIKETHGEAKVIKIKLEKGDKDTIIKHVDRDPVTGKIIHVDFQVIHKGEEVHVDVPLEITGTAKGTKLGGILEVIHWHIPVKGEITNIPPHITIDVTDLNINDSLHVKDLKLKGVKVLLPEEEAIVTVIPPKRMEEVKAAEAPAEEKIETEEKKESE